MTSKSVAGMPIKLNQAGVHICMPDYIDLTAGTGSDGIIDLNTGIRYDAFCDSANYLGFSIVNLFLSSIILASYWENKIPVVFYIQT